MQHTTHFTSIVALGLTLGACASVVERRTVGDLNRTERELEPLTEPSDQESAPATTLDGSRPGYLAYAFASSPALRASFEEWRAATYRPRQERRLPEPTITYAGFIRSVETRVGPQLHKLGAMQWFPWPTKLTAGAKAAAHEAEAAQRRFEAHALEVAARVSRAYWKLWHIHERRKLETERVAILEGLTAQVGVRVEVGGASISDHSQVSLSLSRARDKLAGLDDLQIMAEAELRRAIGAPATLNTPMAADAPAAGEPEAGAASLRVEAEKHPRAEAMAAMARGSDERVRKARSQRFPSLGVGVDWIITGDALDPSMPDSGKDPVIAMAAVKVPLWQRSYGAAMDEARAHGDAHRARELDIRRGLASQVDAVLARIHDTHRRIRLHDTTLVPQAESALESVQGSYQTGRAGVASLLMAEKDLIELWLGRLKAQTEHAIAWSDLEAIVGHSMEVKVDKP